MGLYFLRYMRGLLVRVGLVSLTVATPAFAQSESLRYRVQPGDTVGEVLNILGVCPLWGAGNAVQKTLEINRERLGNRPGDLIFPYDEIHLPVSALPPAADYSVSDDGEVVIHHEIAVARCESKGQPVARAPASTSTEPIVESKPLEVQPVPAVTASWESWVSVEPSFFYSRLVGTDVSNGSKAVFPSRINESIDAQWKVKWSDGFDTALFGGVCRRDYTSVSSRPLDQGSQLFTGFGANAEWHASSDLGLELGGASQERPFYRATTVSQLKVDPVQVNMAQAGVNLDVLHSKSYVLRLQGQGSYLFPTSNDLYSVQAGYGYKGQIEIARRRELAGFGLSGRIFYLFESQDSSLVRIENVDFGIGFGLQWRFGP